MASAVVIDLYYSPINRIAYIFEYIFLNENIFLQISINWPQIHIASDNG